VLIVIHFLEISGIASIENLVFLLENEVELILKIGQVYITVSNRLLKTLGSLHNWFLLCYFFVAWFHICKCA
jgi:hypothetical protein